MNNYFELKLKINPETEDIISDILFDVFDCEGVVTVEETYKDLEMVDTTEGTIKAFIRGEKPDCEKILKEQKELLKSRGMTEEELGSWDFTLEEKENQDWSKKWKEKWDVTHVTENISVVPTWIEYTPKPEEIIIKLDPGCAFGTGTHQTTQLCMKALEKYFKNGQSMADIGMGTGILSILAKKLGASNVYGCDNDETVIDVAKENAELNGEICTFELGTADKIKEKYDFVCANILHNVLFDIMGDLKNIMKDNAMMSLSGILQEKAPVVLEAIERENLKIIEEIQQNQWTSFVVKKG
ncbi:50S ribosomal protein L11 methyltransferase [bacterium]|nr:50S ribosomal protein L11 methyltransferase [bacterium]